MQHSTPRKCNLPPTSLSNLQRAVDNILLDAYQCGTLNDMQVSKVSRLLAKELWAIGPKPLSVNMSDTIYNILHRSN